MYSPPAGGAACRPSATIDKQHASKRRFIISSEEDYLCKVRNSASGRARSRTRRVFADGLSQVRDPTSLYPLLRARGPPMLGVFESARTYRREPALLTGADANCSSKPSQIRTRRRS